MKKLFLLLTILALSWGSVAEAQMAGDARRIWGRLIDQAQPTADQCLMWDDTAKKWKPGQELCPQTQVIDCSAGCSPAAAVLKCGPILSNYGQGAADRSVTLPTAAAGMSFVVQIETTQAANYFRATSTAANIDLDGGAATGKTYVQFAAPTAKNAFSCRSYRTGAATWGWLCFTERGTTLTD